MKLEPCSEPSRVLFYPLSVQSVNALVAELVCSVFEGSRLGAMLVLASLEELSRHEIESLVSFATSLRRIRSNPTPCLRKLCVSKNGENRKPVSHPTLANLDNRLNDSQLEIDQAKQHFGVSRTRRTTPSSATWRSFLKSLKILPPGETFRLVLNSL